MVVMVTMMMMVMMVMMVMMDDIHGGGSDASPYGNGDNDDTPYRLSLTTSPFLKAGCPR
jgi:hypothetical protein